MEDLIGAQNKNSGMKVVLAAIIGNGTICVAKFIAWVIMMSPSMLAEAIHSLADTANQILLLIGLKHSFLQPTKEHPWGYGNARYLWNLISAMGIFFIGFGVTTYHGIHSVLHLTPYDNEKNLILPIGILIFALMVEGYVFYLAFIDVKKKKKQASFMSYIQKGDDPTAVAVLLEDGVAVLGLVLALAGIWLSKVYQTDLPDAIASLLIGVLLGGLALILVRSNSRLLMGAAADHDLEKRIRKYLSEHKSIDKITSFRTEILGPGRLRLASEVEFHGESLINREQIIKDAEKIRSGESDPVPVLVDTSERMVRTLGKAINEIEAELKVNFPQLDIIEIEVN